MLILRANRELSPEALARLGESLSDLVRGTEHSRLLILDAGLRVFQPVDGVWREVGEPVEDAQLFLAQRSDLGVCRELVTRAVARLHQLGDRALAAQIAETFRVPAADLAVDDSGGLLIEAAGALTILGHAELARELLEQHGLLRKD